MSEINAFHTAPAGYTRSHVSMRSHGCKRHAVYALFCAECGWEAVRTPITLGSLDADGDRVLALILDHDGDVYEWLTADSGREFASNVVSSGSLVILDTPETWDSPTLQAAMHEATLNADCFALTLDDLAPSETPTLIHA